MKLLFIVAPTIGEETRAVLKTALQDLSSECEIFAVTPDVSIPEVVSARLHEGFDGVVAVGGDGTVSSVAHALTDTHVPLGIVPAGTGNLVARELGIPLDPRAAVALAAGPHALRAIDAMLINGFTYLLNAGVGINAEVIDRTSRLGKSLFGRTAYVGTAVWKVLQAKPQHLTISIDGEEARTYDATDVLISNCGMLVRVLHPNCPDVRADDGQVDVCIICMKVAIEYPWYYFIRKLFPRSIFPRHVNRIIHELPASRSVSIDCETPIVVQADGDIIGTTPVTINVRPKALSVIVPSAPGAEEVCI